MIITIIPSNIPNQPPSNIPNQPSLGAGKSNTQKPATPGLSEQAYSRVRSILNTVGLVSSELKTRTAVTD